MPGGSPLIIHSWFRPSSGVNLFLGSHSRQRAIRLTKLGSGFSLNLTMMYRILSSFYSWLSTAMGSGTAPSLNWVNKCFLVERANTLWLGMPMTSIINCIYSRSLVPGKSGNPVNSSIMMQPNDHMSICWL
jgi:hypothetical protein